ncbi:MAG: hypothetical protein M1133_06905 [Armatimonadetes bacterium]|nr:hypothetical protein [Armatimonadota bacterium]
MRFTLIVLLMLSPVCGEARTLDPLATDAITHVGASVRKTDHLTEDQEKDLRIAMYDAANADPKFENALIFGESANRLLKAARNNNGVLTLLLLDGADSDWNDLQRLGTLYRKDGSLPAVNYRNITTPHGLDKLRRVIPPIGAWEDYQDLFSIYSKARKAGVAPDKAFLDVQKYAVNIGDRGSGLSALESQLHSAGKFALTGYDSTSAQKDAGHFLESYYAYKNPDAGDIKGVTPALDPFEFISNRVYEGIRQDLHDMLKPVRDVIAEKLDSEIPKPRAKPAPGSSMPSYEQMRRPDKLLSSPLGPGSSQSAWYPSQFPNKDIEYKWVRIEYGVDVMKCRQVSNDRFHTIGTSGSLDQPSKVVEVAFNVWYWAEEGTEAYFADGSGRPGAPVENYVSLPPSMGESFPVRLTVKPDADNKFHIVFRARGRCALTLDEFYYFHPTDRVGPTDKK